MRPPLLEMRIRSRFPGSSDVLHNIFDEKARKDPKTGKDRPHAGWDLEAPIGTPVYAIASGRIVDVRYSDSYGNIVALEFMEKNSIYFAFYAHLMGALERITPQVNEGDIIALTGNTGKSAEGEKPHLHFEIRYLPFLPPGLGTGGRIDPALFFGRYLICS